MLLFFSFLGKDCTVSALQQKLLIHFIRKNATSLRPRFSNEFFAVKPIWWSNPLNICIIVILIQGSNLNNFINNDYYYLFTKLEQRLELPPSQRRSLNEKTDKAEVSFCTNTHDKLVPGWKNFWSKAVLSATANFLNWKNFAESTGFNHTSCISSSQLWHTLLHSIRNCPSCLSNHLAGTSGSLSASPCRHRTAPPTCHFPRFLKLEGILAILPDLQVICTLLNFSSSDQYDPCSWDY